MLISVNFYPFSCVNIIINKGNIKYADDTSIYLIIFLPYNVNIIFFECQRLTFCHIYKSYIFQVQGIFLWTFLKHICIFCYIKLPITYNIVFILKLLLSRDTSNFFSYMLINISRNHTILI